MQLKKVTLALMALGVSGLASAAAYVPAPAPAPACIGENVTVPCPGQGFSLGADFIYVQPTGLNFNDPNKTLKWAPGVRVEGAYLFGNGNDINVNFTWFEKGSQREQNFAAIPDQDTTASINSRFWNINAEFGQTANYGEAVTMRYHVGMQYADISRDVRNYFGDQQRSDHSFQGFGPRVGVDAGYEIMDSGFSLVGKAAGALLIGDTKVTARDFEGDLLLSDKTRNVVPALEAKLGGEYAFELPEMAGDLLFEAGYQWAGYFDSIQSPVISQDQTNFGYHGIYVGLKWVGDTAFLGLA